MPEPTTDVYSDRDAAPEMEAEVESETESTEDAPDKESDGDDKASESATGLVSKSLFSGKEIKPGYKCSIVVEKVYDDQVSISLAGKSEDSEDESEAIEESVYD